MGCGPRGIWGSRWTQLRPHGLGFQRPHFTPFLTPCSAGVNLLHQDLSICDGITVNAYVFPAFSLIGPLLRFLRSQRAIYREGSIYHVYTEFISKNIFNLLRDVRKQWYVSLRISINYLDSGENKTNCLPRDQTFSVANAIFFYNFSTTTLIRNFKKSDRSLLFTDFVPSPLK